MQGHLVEKKKYNVTIDMLLMFTSSQALHQINKSAQLRIPVSIMQRNACKGF